MAGTEVPPFSAASITVQCQTFLLDSVKSCPRPDVRRPSRFRSALHRRSLRGAGTTSTRAGGGHSDFDIDT
jgi:hypothetical protein